MPDNNVINKQIVDLLNLQDDYEISYEDYFRALREAAIAARMVNSKYSFDEADLITVELTRVKKLDKNTVFVTSPDGLKEKTKKPEAKSKTVNVNNFLNKKLPSSDPVNNKINKKALLPKKEADQSYKKASKPPEEVNTQKTQKDNEGILSILKNIDKTLESILTTLINLNKSQQKSLERDRLGAERGRREKGESKLEAGGGLKKITDLGKKALRPLQSVFDGLIDFLKKVILGRIFNMFVDWLKDPNNKKTFDTIVKFVADHWPLFLGAFVLFGTSFGTFIRWFIGTAARFSLSFLKIIPQLISAIAKTKLGLAGLVGAGLFAAGAIIPKLFPQTVDAEERKTEKVPGTKNEKVEKLKEQKKNLNWFDQLRGVGSEIDEQIHYLETGKTKSYAEGGTLESDTKKSPNIADKLKGIFGNAKQNVFDSISNKDKNEKGSKLTANNFTPKSNVGLPISGAGRDNTLLSASPGDAVLTSDDIKDIKNKYGINISKNIGKGNSPTNYGTNQVAVNTNESILSLNDQKDLYSKYGINIPEYLQGRKPKTVKSSNIKVNNGYSSGGVIGQYQSGGIVQNTAFNPIAFNSSPLTSTPSTPFPSTPLNLSGLNSASISKPVNFKIDGKQDSPSKFDFKTEYYKVVNILDSITSKDKKSAMQKQADEIREMRERSLQRQGKSVEKKDSQNYFQTAFSPFLNSVNSAFSSVWNFLGNREEEKTNAPEGLNNTSLDPKVIDHIVNICVKRVSDIIRYNVNPAAQQEGSPAPSPVGDIGDSRPTIQATQATPSASLVSVPGLSQSAPTPTASPAVTTPSSGGYNLFGGDKPKPDAAHKSSGVGTSAAKILQGAKSIVGMGRGSGNKCADTTRAALKAAGHPAANKRTKIGDLDTPKGTAYNGASFAASFGGSDMGQIITQKSQIKAGDLVLWKQTSSGGKYNKGAITHVGIAADDGLKNQYDHNTSRGFHYRPHWDSAAGTSWFAGVRLNGTGGGGSTSSTASTKDKETPAQGGSGGGGGVGDVGDVRSTWTKEDQIAFDAKGTKGVSEIAAGLASASPSQTLVPGVSPSGKPTPSASPSQTLVPGISPSGKPTPSVSSSEIDKMSIEQLRGMLDPTKTGASNPAVFDAARSARAEAVALGLPKEEVERRVLVASVKAKQGIVSNRSSFGGTDNSISGTVNELRQMRARSLERQGRTSEASILRAYGTKMPNLLGNQQNLSLSSGFNIPKGSPEVGFKPMPGLTNVTENTGKPVTGASVDSRRVDGGIFGKFDVSPGEILMNPYVITKEAANKGAATEALSSVKSVVANYDSASKAAQENITKKPTDAFKNIKPYSANNNKPSVSTLPPITKNTGSPGSPPISGTKEVFFKSVCPIGHAMAERQRILDSLGVLFV